MRYWDIFTGSFYSADAYRRMRYQAQGGGLGYSFVLVAITSVLLVFFVIAMANVAFFTPVHGHKPLFDDMIDQAVAQAPVMTFKDGILVAQTNPTTITLDTTVFNHPDHWVFATIDTSGATTHENMKTSLLVTDKEIVLRNKEKTEIYPLKNYSHTGQAPLVMDHAYLQDMATTIKQLVHAKLWEFYLIMGFFAWCILAATLYVFRLIMLVCLAVIAIAISSYHKQLEFTQALRLSAMAYTPVAAVDMLVLIICVHSLPHLVLFVMGVIVLACALSATNEPEAV